MTDPRARKGPSTLAGARNAGFCWRQRRYVVGSRGSDAIRKLSGFSLKVLVVGCLGIPLGAIASASPIAGASSTTAAVLTTTASMTPGAGALAVVDSRLNAYVAAEQASDAIAGKGSPNNIWGNPVISEHSSPVLEDHTNLAVAAFSFDPRGHPVQVLSYLNGKWSLVAALATPSSPGTIYHADSLDLFSENTPVTVDVVTGESVPDFLIKFAGAGCSSAAVVSQVGTHNGWRYVPFTGSTPKSDVVGGNPRFVGSTLMTDNACTAVPIPAAQRYRWIWTYHPSSGTMAAVRRSGWPANPWGASSSS
jgi:hypothetical protein